MKIREYKIPTFEEWVRNNYKADIIIGNYRCAIGAISWNNDYTRYMFALSMMDVNPINIYSYRLFSKCIKFDGNVEKLRLWYNDTIEEFYNFWENNIKLT